jgi:hypothetical protein
MIWLRFTAETGPQRALDYCFAKIEMGAELVSRHRERTALGIRVYRGSGIHLGLGMSGQRTLS